MADQMNYNSEAPKRKQKLDEVTRVCFNKMNSPQPDEFMFPPSQHHAMLAIQTHVVSPDMQNTMQAVEGYKQIANFLKPEIQETGKIQHAEAQVELDKMRLMVHNQQVLDERQSMDDDFDQVNDDELLDALIYEYVDKVEEATPLLLRDPKLGPQLQKVYENTTIDDGPIHQEAVNAMKTVMARLPIDEVQVESEEDRQLLAKLVCEEIKSRAIEDAFVHVDEEKRPMPGTIPPAPDFKDQDIVQGYCVKCGAKSGTGDTFCNNCGNKHETQ